MNLRSSSTCDTTFYSLSFSSSVKPNQHNKMTDMQMILEKLSKLDKLDTIETKLEQVDQKMNAMNLKLTNLETKVNFMENRVKVLENSMNVQKLKIKILCWPRGKMKYYKSVQKKTAANTIF